MSKRILIIDDDEIVLKTLKRLLLKEGFKVRAALTGKTALKMITDADFDLIICDLKMPEIDGVKTLQMIRDYLSRNHKPLVPEVIITGFANEAIYQEACALHPTACIDKPFDIKLLLEAIRTATKGKKP